MIALVGGVGYGATAAALLVLLALAALAARRSVAALLLIGACAATLAWAAAAAAQVSTDLDPRWVLWLEALRAVAWLAFLGALLPLAETRRLRVAAGYAAGASALAGAAVLVAHFGYGAPGALPLLVLAIGVLVAVEQVYRNSDAVARWRVKYLCIALLLMFGFDVYLYADALLFGNVDAHAWAARGVANVLAVPLIAVAAARNPQWKVEVFVSRQVVFHSAVLIAVGIALSAMAAAGYYVRYFGGSWGSALQALAVATAAAVLLVVLLSGALRARLRVFLGKHFFSSRFDYRDSWLRFTRSLSSCEPAGLRTQTVRALGELVDADAGWLWLRRDAAYVCVAAWNVPPVADALRADTPLVRFLEQRQWVVDVREFARSPARYPGLTAVPGSLLEQPRAHLVMPLVSREALLGFVVLDRPRGALKVDWEVHDLLKTAGRQAATHLAQAEAAEALATARQFESFNRLAAFVVHDLKNVVGQLGLLLGNAARHRDNPAFQADMLETVEHAVARMRRLLAQLGAQEAARAAQPLSLQTELQGLLNAFAHHVPRPILHHPEEPVQVLADGERLRRILGHLVHNAVEATPAHGEVTVTLALEGGQAVVRVCDTGCGMSQAFIEQRLFKPFSSTKPGGMGIGVYETRQFVLEAGGDLQVRSRPGAGSEFTVRLPAYSGAPSLQHAGGIG